MDLKFKGVALQPGGPPACGECRKPGDSVTLPGETTWRDKKSGAYQHPQVRREEKDNERMRREWGSASG